MELTDLKIEAKPNKDVYGGPSMTAAVKAPHYPYGTCLYLEADTLEKMGIVNPPQVGDRMNIKAFGIVQSVSLREDGTGEKKMCVELQLTHMNIGPIADYGQEQKADMVFYGRPRPAEVIG